MLNEQPQLLLRVLTGPNAGAEALLASGATVLGNAETSDLVLADPAIVAAHVSILVEGERAVLQVEGEPVWIGGAFVTEQTVELADYQVFRLGGSSCAIGRHGDDWPDFDPADLFADTFAPPAAPPAARREDDATGADGRPGTTETVTAADPGPETSSVPAAPAVPLWVHLWRKPAVLGAASFLCLLLAGAGLYAALVAGGAAESGADGAATAGALIRQKLTELRLEDRITIEETPSGQVVLTGYVSSSAELSLLRNSLRNLDVTPVLRVAALDRQKIAAETLISRMGGSLSVALDEEKGVLVLSGFLPTQELVDLLVASLEREIPGLRPLDARIDTVATVLAEARARLERDGLEDKISVSADDLKVRFQGRASDTARRSLEVIVRELSASWGRVIVFSDDTRGPAGQVATVPPTVSDVESQRPQAAVPAPVSAPRGPSVALDFTVIVAGENAMARDSLGRRYQVGDKLPNGYLITEIDAEGVTATRNGKTKTYSHRR